RNERRGPALRFASSKTQNAKQKRSLQAGAGPLEADRERLAVQLLPVLLLVAAEELHGLLNRLGRDLHGRLAPLLAILASVIAGGFQALLVILVEFLELLLLAVGEFEGALDGGNVIQGTRARRAGLPAACEGSLDVLLKADLLEARQLLRFEDLA